MKNLCRDKRGNELCTNGKDTYHEWNTKYGSHCNFCGQLGKNPIKKDSDYCECQRCKDCGKIIKKI